MPFDYAISALLTLFVVVDPIGLTPTFLAVTDELTGLRNRRSFEERLVMEFSMARRRKRELSVLLIDVDNFKTINDRWGHAAGDEVLRRLGTILRTTVRLPDLPARYGGEEFAVVMPETTLADARTVAEHLRQLVAQHPFHYLERKYQVTISLGVAGTSGEDWLAPSELIRQADENLYEAKRQGRNRVIG